MPTIFEHSIEDMFMRSIVLLSAAFALAACAETNPSAATETSAQDSATTISEPLSETEAKPQPAGLYEKAFGPFWFKVKHVRSLQPFLVVLL